MVNILSFFPFFIGKKIFDFVIKNPFIFSLIIFNFFLSLELIYNFNVIILIIFFISFTLLLYIYLYTKFYLKQSIFSFLSFLLFLLIFSIYLYGFYNIYKGISEPIYLNNLSTFSYTRYILLTILGSFFFLYWLIKMFKKNIYFNLNIFNYLNMKEEIRKILYLWNDGFIGDICCYLFNKIATSKIFSYMYFLFHFFLFYLIRFISLILLVNFVFFYGDLLMFRYILPTLFLVWLLGFFDYYFTIFREGTVNYLADILIVNNEGNNTSLLYNNKLLLCYPDNLTFKLSSMAEKEGFTIADLDFLKSKWYMSGEVGRKFIIYDYYMKMFTLVLVIIMYICWLSISIYFFKSKLSYIQMEVWPIFRRFPLRPAHFGFGRFPREARFAKEGKPMNDLKVLTKGSYSPGHPVAGEEVKGSQFRVDGSWTHGKKKEFIPLSPTGIPSDTKSISFVPNGEGPILVPINLLENTPIPNSEAFLEQPHIKEILDNICKK